MEEFASLPRKVDGIGKWETQFEEKEDEFYRLEKSLNLPQNAYEQLLITNDALSRDVCQSTTRLEELFEDEHLTRADELLLE